ncbi:histone chaperone [Lactarius quietus]|nr:histone chaperone [Lactarius quietus]
MSIVTIRNVEFLNNPARFLDPYRFRVTFECIASLKEDIEWRLIYVASPGNAELDQELDDCLVGPVPVGVNAFEFEGSPPSPQSIPPEDVLGVAALILTGSYRDQEFVRVGDISAKPRVTRFQIKWDVSPQSGTVTAAGAATSAAVPSANDLEGDASSNGTSTS